MRNSPPANRCGALAPDDTCGSVGSAPDSHCGTDRRTSAPCPVRCTLRPSADPPPTRRRGGRRSLYRIGELGAPVVSIGGAGTFDGVFITGLVAGLLT